MQSLHACPRPGHDEFARHCLRSRRQCTVASARDRPPVLSAAGLGRARRARDLASTRLATIAEVLARLAQQLPTSPQWASRISARPSYFGIGAAVSRLPVRSSGRIGARRSFAHSCCSAGHEAQITRRTGLLLDPLLLGHQARVAPRACARSAGARERGELAFGTIDSWLIWNLTGGRHHVTDVTNASRTLLCNIKSGAWDAELLELFRIPRSLPAHDRAELPAEAVRSRRAPCRIARSRSPASQAISTPRSSANAASLREWQRIPMAPDASPC